MYIDEPLFDTARFGRYACDRCFDLGIWLTPRSGVEVCPNIRVGAPHAEPNEAAVMIRTAAEHLRENKQSVNTQTFDVARLLSKFTSADPCPRQHILKNFFSYLPMTEANQLRKFHAVVEDLRRNWALPVGSRKDAPAGYWIITDLDDFKMWVERAKSAPLTQLTTIHRVAKRNFPVFAEQLEIEFWGDDDAPGPLAA
ncbi:MAG: hypothetical protein ABI539_08350 [Acidobacteriota bacterium]